jgi:predicted ester cyclase
MSLTLTGSINRIANDFTEEIWDKGNFKIADEILSINFIDHDPVTGQLPGLIGYKQMVKDFRNAFPDLRVKNEDVIVEGNKVVVRWTANGKHSGQLMNIPPTNKQVILKGIDILLVENNKITERWGEYDALGMLSQLGVLPQ